VVHVARMEGRRNSHKIFVGKHEVKRHLGTSRCKYKDNIKQDI